MKLPEPAIKLTPKKRHQFGQPVNLFTAQQMLEYRRTVLEEAAAICDRVDKESQSQWPHRFATMLRDLKGEVK